MRRLDPGYGDSLVGAAGNGDLEVCVISGNHPEGPQVWGKKILMGAPSDKDVRA